MAADTTPSLPKFDPKKVYLIQGKTMNDIMATLRTYRPRVVTGGGIRIVSQSEDGTFLSADTNGLRNALNIPNFPNFSNLNLNVCIDGVSTPKTFLTIIG